MSRRENCWLSSQYGTRYKIFAERCDRQSAQIALTQAEANRRLRQVTWGTETNVGRKVLGGPASRLRPTSRTSRHRSARPLPSANITSTAQENLVHRSDQIGHASSCGTVRRRPITQRKWVDVCSLVHARSCDKRPRSSSKSFQRRSSLSAITCPGPASAWRRASAPSCWCRHPRARVPRQPFPRIADACSPAHGRC